MSRLTSHQLTSLLSSMEQRSGPLSEDRVWRVASSWPSFMAQFVLAESGPHKVALKMAKNWDASDVVFVASEVSRVRELLNDIPSGGVTMPAVLGVAIDPPALALEYVKGSRMFEVLGHLDIETGTNLMDQSGQALGAYHKSQVAPPGAEDDDYERALAELLTAARRAAVSRRRIVSIEPALIRARGYRFSTNDFVLDQSQSLVLMDPPHVLKYDYVHRDIGVFLIEMRRSIAGDHPGEPESRSRSQLAKLREAFLGGYAATGPTSIESANDELAVALFSIARIQGIAYGRLRSGKIGPASSMLAWALRERLRQFGGRR